MATLVLTVLGEDRPGLVSALSAPVSAHGGLWERSRLSRLEGKFAGIVLVTVPDARCGDLVADLEALASEGLHVVVERSGAPAEQPSVALHLQLLGADRPGIVAEVSSALAEHGVSIEELTTDVREAPMAGGLLFETTAVLSAPPSSSTDHLRSVLEALADELMVDVALTQE